MWLRKSPVCDYARRRQPRHSRPSRCGDTSCWSGHLGGARDCAERNPCGDLAPPDSLVCEEAPHRQGSRARQSNPEDAKACFTKARPELQAIREVVADLRESLYAALAVLAEIKAAQGQLPQAGQAALHSISAALTKIMRGQDELIGSSQRRDAALDSVANALSEIKTALDAHTYAFQQRGDALDGMARVLSEIKAAQDEQRRVSNDGEAVLDSTLAALTLLTGTDVTVGRIVCNAAENTVLYCDKVVVRGGTA